jgi:hypothetical protein
MLLYLGGPIDLSSKAQRDDRARWVEELGSAGLTVYDPAAAFKLHTFSNWYPSDSRTYEAIRAINNRAMFLADIVLFLLPSDTLSVGSVTELVDYSHYNRNSEGPSPSVVVYMPLVDDIQSIPIYLRSILKVGSTVAHDGDAIICGDDEGGVIEYITKLVHGYHEQEGTYTNVKNESGGQILIAKAERQ